jgi:hypothetical protein
MVITAFAAHIKLMTITIKPKPYNKLGESFMFI